MKKMTLSLSHSLKWNSQIWDKDQCKTAFCIAKALLLIKFTLFFFSQTRTNNQSTTSKTQIEPSNSNHSASKPENQPHPEMPIQPDPAVKTKICPKPTKTSAEGRKLTGFESINEVRLILVREES